MKSKIQRIVCILLVVLVLSMSLSAFAVDPAPEETPEIDDGLGTVTDTMMSYYIYMCLRSWGINIQYGEIDGFLDEVDNMIVNMVVEYLASLPSAYEISTWIAPWQGSMDYWGNYTLNDSALEDIREFADWLVSRYNLEDNSTTITNPTMSVNGAYVFETNTFYTTSSYYDDGNLYFNMANSTEPDGSGTNKKPYWFILQNTVGNGVLFVFFKEEGTTVNSPDCYLGMNSNGNIEHLQSQSVSWSDRSLTRFGYNFGYVELLQDEYGNTNKPVGYSAINYNFNGESNPFNIVYYYIRSIDSFDVVAEGDHKIIVTTNNIPVPGEDYPSGSSITIIGDNPQYQMIDWDGHVTVDNLPAVISPATIQDPDLNSAYQEITPFFRTVESGLAVVRGVILLMPVEVLSCLFALMGAMIVFGILKIMREH